MLLSLGFLVLLVAVPSLTYPKNEQDPVEIQNVAATVLKGRTERIARLLIEVLLSKCQRVLDLGAFRQFQRPGGLTQLRKDFIDLAPTKVRQSRTDPYKRVGYAAGKKIEINERRYTLEIKYKSSTGVLRLDQIEYYDLEPL